MIVVVGEGGAADDRLLEAEILVLLHEAQRIGAGEPAGHHIAILNLRDERRVVRRRQRRPDFLHDLAAEILERALEAADLLVAECKIVAHGDRGFDLQFLEGVIGHRIHALRGAVRRAHDERIGLALGDILRAGVAERRHLVLREIVDDREMFERRERSHDHVDLVALDEFDRLGLGAGRIAAGVRDDQFDLAAGQA